MSFLSHCHRVNGQSTEKISAKVRIFYLTTNFFVLFFTFLWLCDLVWTNWGVLGDVFEEEERGKW